MRRERHRDTLIKLRTLLDHGGTAGVTDGQLLEQFATRCGEGSELAFTALVNRHGPMVLRVCQSIAAAGHDAEDAFQATFLVLARTGHSLWVRDSLGPWLHRVACRVAIHARRADARRRRAERIAAAKTRDRHHDGPDDRWQDLHEEIDRLPERYRLPIVLCDLQGRTYEEAARSIGCPTGTVKSRLARARERLRERLVRHDHAAADGIPGTGGLIPLAPIALPGSLVEWTTGNAVQFAAGDSVSGPLAVLADKSLGRMSMIRFARAAMAVVALGIVGAALVQPNRVPHAEAIARGNDAPRSDLEAIQGSWMRISTDGVATVDAVRRIRMVITRDTARPDEILPPGVGRFLFEWKSDASKRGSTNRVLLDPTRNPKALDFFPDQEKAPRVCPGIYDLEGDVLTICFLAIQGERPRGFTDRKPGETLDVYRRVRP